jgi:hypothetical protein
LVIAGVVVILLGFAFPIVSCAKDVPAAVALCVTGPDVPLVVVGAILAFVGTVVISQR